MPDIADDNWSERDDQNAEVAPYGWPPGVPAQIELIGRMMMGAIKRSWRRFNPFYPTTGTADAYVVTPSSNPQFINIYEIIRVRIDRANTTTAPTLKYGGANARTIKRITPAGKVAVAVGDLVAGKDHGFWYDGTDFILMDPATISGTLVTGALLAANNLSDVLSASTALSNIGGAPLNSPTFTGIVTIPSGAIIAGYAPLASPTFTGTVTIPSGASIAGYALLASPAFTGNPTAPTQSAGDNSTKLATTAYADGAVATSIANLKWRSRFIGEIVYANTAVTGAEIPPSSTTDTVWIELTSGLTGVGQFNNGKLTSESVSGSAPLVLATAVISFAGSAMNGQTIRLINTESRILRPSISPGTIQDDAAQGHIHALQTTVFTGGAGGIGTGAGNTSPLTIGGPITDGVNGTPRTANETRMKNIGVKAYMRIA